MLKIFLASHAHLASGMKSSLDLLFGECPNLRVFDAYVESDERLTDELDTFFQMISEDDDVLLLSDIYGGSVNTQMCSYLNRPKTRLVTGINLSFLIEIASTSVITDERLDEIIEQSRFFMRRVVLDGEGGDDMNTASNSEDEFF